MIKFERDNTYYAFEDDIVCDFASQFSERIVAQLDRGYSMWNITQDFADRFSKRIS